MPRNYHHWKQSEIEYIRNNRSKLSVKEMSIHLGIASHNIQGIITRQGMYKRNKPEVVYPPQSVLRELAEQGHNIYSMKKIIEVIKTLNP
jgi:hypothetical protein